MSSIECFSGALGNGKSVIVNSIAFKHLKRGGVLGLNYPLVDDWAIKYATRTLPLYVSDQQILDKAVEYYERVFRFGSIQSCYDFSEKVAQLATGKQAKTREEWGLLVIDEASLYFNAREFRSNRNTDYIQLFINVRKLKIKVFLMTHCPEDIDKQIRGKIDAVTYCRNMQKRRFLGFPLEIFYKTPKFRTQSIVIGDGAFKGMIEDKQTYSLDLTTCDLFDTFQLFKDDELGHEFPLSHQGKHPQEYFKTAAQKRAEEMAAITESVRDSVQTIYYPINQPCDYASIK